MKYVNSLKYMNSFECTEDMSKISSKRARELCELIGRVNIGTKSIFIPGGASGHATAVLLESVIKSVGYNVGRITSSHGFGSREIVYFNGDYPEIELYNRAVAEIKSAVLKEPDKKYFLQEVSYAAALLMCKMKACDYIILEGMSSSRFDLASLCAPYDIVIAPAAYSDEDISVRLACDAIRHGTREAVSGNQRKPMYDMIFQACAACGVKLMFTMKTSFATESVSSIKRSFSYGGREGYILKSPSLMLCDCAMLVIESALAIRRDGVRMPWAAISSGLSTAVGMGCFETMSASPLAVFDSAKDKTEAEFVSSTLDEVFGEEKNECLVLCLPSPLHELKNVFSNRRIEHVIAVGDSEECISCKDAKAAAKEMFSVMKAGKDVICLGSLAFSDEIRVELLKLVER